MPTIILKYNLPEEEVDARMAQRGGDFHRALCDIDELCRRLLKHGNPPQKLVKFAEEIREAIREAGVYED